jgi:predicted transposase YdaD
VAYADQLRSGDHYGSLKATYAISLLMRNLWKDDDRIHHRFLLVDRESDQVLENAIEELEGIQFQTEEKAMYDSREKAALDLCSSLSVARKEGELIGEARGRAEGEARGRAEGEARGRAEGEARGKIRALQQVLNRPEISDEAFAALSSSSIAQLIEELQNEARNRS